MSSSTSKNAYQNLGPLHCAQHETNGKYVLRAMKCFTLFLMTGPQNPPKTPKLPEVWGEILSKNML